MRVKHFFLIFLYFNTLLVLYADETISLTFKNVGDRDAHWEIIIFNTRIDGFVSVYEHAKTFDFLYYYRLPDYLLEEIIEIIKNSELFSNNFDPKGFGCFELYIEKNEEEYYYYLNNRESSIQFFRKMIELIDLNIQNKYYAKKIISKLKEVIRRI